MFTIDQIKQAHSKVKSGADFPAYIREIKVLGVRYYETFVSDGHTDFKGGADYRQSTQPRYETLTIASTPNIAQFKADLKAHQQGQSDYPTFCRACADYGVEKWAVDLEKLTCTYFDKNGNIVLVEQIPQ